ncbi:hypothetical protein [Dyella psychrodurans]|uniref:hypothetical protein n=1 Tax=Dyella psychrodurans TaxID=1927960 RepID=UPI001314B390|nr:hypothetical protein [Dyella psychrodurans]
MKRSIRLVKLVILMVSIAWAIYATYASWAFAALFKALSKNYPGSAHGVTQGATGLAGVLADAQLCAVVFGPAIIALVLFVWGWPERKFAQQKQDIQIVSQQR